MADNENDTFGNSEEEDDNLLSDDDISSILDGASLDGLGDDDVLSPDDLAGIVDDGGGSGDLGDLLDQGSIDALMQDSATEGETIILYNGERLREGVEISIEEYDFANPHFLSEAQMRRVRLRHEQFIFNAASRLSMQLKTDFTMRMARLETQPYQTFTDNISNPSHIVLFKLGEVPGVGIVAMGARLAMTIIDRLLGGGGHSVKEERFLSDLEVVLLEDFLSSLIEQWCSQWEDLCSLRHEIVGYENHGRFLSTSPRDTQVLILSIEATLGDCTDTIQIGIPYYSIEPIIKKLQEHSDSNGQPKREAVTNNWWGSCNGIQVEVKAEWSAFECQVRDILQLRKGDVLTLQPNLIEETELWCNNSLRFRGKIGLKEDKVVVEVREKTEIRNSIK